MSNIFKIPQKTALLALAFALGLSASLVTLDSSFAAASKTYKIGDSFSEKGINAGKLPYVTNILNKDLSGDKKVDQLLVVGDRFDKDSLSYNSFIYIYKDGKTGKQTVTKMPYIEGYSAWGYAPVVEMVDLNSDSLPEVQFSSFSGGSGGFVYYNVASFKDGKYKQLLGQKELSGLDVTGKYVDGFKAEMTCIDIKKTWLQDLSFQKDSLIEMKVYDASGKLLTPIEPWTGPFVNLKIDSGMVTGIQSLKGIANADYIGALRMTYFYQNGKLELKEVTVESILKGFN